MLEGLHWIFIQPIEILLTFIFSITEDLTPSRSAQIIYLSLAISILLVPIYNLFDYWQNRDRIVEKAMNPKLKMVKNSFHGQERFAMLKTVYQQFDYHPIYGVRNSLGFLLQIPFFIAAYQFLSYNPAFQDVSSGMFKNLSAPDQLIQIGDMRFNLWPILMTVFNLLSGFIYSKGLMRKDKIQIVAVAVIFLILLYNSASGLVLYWTFNNIFSLIKNLIHRYYSPSKRVNRFILSQKILPYLSATLFLTIAFFYFPSILIESDPFVWGVENNQNLVFSSYLSALIIGLYLVYVVKYFCVGLTKLIDISLFVFAIFALITSCYNIFDTGAIDQFKIANIEQGLGPILNRLIVDVIVIGIAIAIYFLVQQKWNNIFLGLSIISFLTITIYTVTTVPVISKKIESSGEKGKEGAFIPAYIDSAATFSTNHPNILVLMLDGFTNPLLGEFIKSDLNLSSDLAGFTWYQNTLSTGNYTYLSSPSIHGGLALSPYEINKRSDEIESIADEINKGYLPLLQSLMAENYQIDLLNMQYTDCDSIEALANLSVCTEYDKNEDDLDAYYVENNDDIFPDDLENILEANSNRGYLPSIGLFYASFYSLREFIYNDSQWLSFVNNLPSFNINYSYYAFLTSFIDLMKTNKTEGPTYKYINSGFTHENWHFYDESCHLSKEGGYYSDENQTAVNKQQFYTHYCSIKELQRLIHRLKQGGAWDNTMLVLVSDHSTKGDVQLAEIFNDSLPGIDFRNYPGRPSSLLLVKDFNNDQDFQVSNTYMMQADVPSIVCTAINGCDSIAQDPRLDPNPNRKRIHATGGWQPKRHEKRRFILHEIWEVTGDMYQRENWKKIEEKPSQ